MLKSAYFKNVGPSIANLNSPRFAINVHAYVDLYVCVKKGFHQFNLRVAFGVCNCVSRRFSSSAVPFIFLLYDTIFFTDFHSDFFPCECRVRGNGVMQA